MLSKTVADLLTDENSQVYVSVPSAWEMAIKVGLGKWPEAAALMARFESELASVNFELLPISVEHARQSGVIISSHRDPFDRLLAAQAIVEGLELVTADAKLQSLGVPIVW